MGAALTISLIALAVTGFGIGLQWSMYKASTQQLVSAQTILARLEGVSLQLREVQQDQFGSLLNAVLRQATVSEAGEQAITAEDRIKRLEVLLAEQPEVAKELGELRAAVDGLRDNLRELETDPSSYSLGGVKVTSSVGQHTHQGLARAQFQRVVDFIRETQPKTSDTAAQDNSGERLPKAEP